MCVMFGNCEDGDPGIVKSPPRIQNVVNAPDTSFFPAGDPAATTFAHRNGAAGSDGQARWRSN